MRRLYSSAAALLFVAVFTFAQAPSRTAASSLRQRAEAAYAEKSYSTAHDLYAQIDASTLSPEEKRWRDFRLADTQWRAEANDPSADTTKIDEARKELERLIREAPERETPDRVWAEANESIADLNALGRGASGSGSYDAALGWWAAQSDLDLARSRYLAIVFKMAASAEPRQAYFYPAPVRIDYLENAVKIAVTPADRAHALLLLARSLQYQGGDAARIAATYEAAVREGKASGYYDAALFHFAQWLAQSGRTVQQSDGSFVNAPDLTRALELYRTILREFTPSTSAFYDDAKAQIEQITRPAIDLAVTGAFLPDSEVDYYLNTRNVPRVDLKLYAVDLTRDVRDLSREKVWRERIDVSGRQPLRSWSQSIDGSEDHVQRNEHLFVEQKLPRGAYLLVASGSGVTTREIILVTDLALITKRSQTKFVVFACNAITGQPVANARIAVIEMPNETDRATHRYDATTSSDGLAEVAASYEQGASYVAFANDGASQTFDEGYSPWWERNLTTWHIYAFTDRPAYRPNEEVQWKAIVRSRTRGAYATPAGERIRYEIHDPRNSKVDEGTLQLNAFGSATGKLSLTASMPLGAYTVYFYRGDEMIGQATLFRLEEYKLPEYHVEVKTPEENGRKKIFRLGDTVDVTIRATYYFGAPVANASVQAVVRMQPYSPLWYPRREYDWFYPQTPQPYGNGQIVQQETLTTDANGEAHLRIVTTPASAGAMNYEIEARVVDASRREVVASDTINVASQSYFAHLTPQHFLITPGSPARIDIKTVDANEQPVSVSGRVAVTRESWRERWISPEGKEVSDAEMHRATAGHDTTGWRLKSRGYTSEDVTSQNVTTNEAGEATFTFVPARDGYYRVRWIGVDRADTRYPKNIIADAAVWVADRKSADIGYHNDQLQLIVDADSLHAGTRGAAMVVAPASGQTVLFTIEGDDLFETRVLRMDGNVQLVPLDVDDRFIPNVTLSALAVNDASVMRDQQDVVVPPESHFVDVKVAPDRAEARPREKGSIVITTTDKSGKPVAAEVALGIADESVYAIQKDLADDPRKFFFGERRPNRVQTSTSFDRLMYQRRERDHDRGVEGGVEGGVAGGVVGGVVGGMRNEAVPPPPPSPVAQSITVTAAAPVLMDAKKELPMSRDMAKVAELAPAGGNTVTVRNDFRSTIFWDPTVITDATGKARVEFTYPDSLTSWRMTARAVTATTQVGQGTASTSTSQPLIARLEAPRFFVVGDRTVVSAVVNNNTDAPLDARVSVNVEGLDAVEAAPSDVTVPVRGETRVDWNVRATTSGAAKIRVTAAGKESDAMERVLPVFEHGIEKFVSRSGKSKAEETTVLLTLPAARRPGSTQMTVQVTPSLAVTMLDALPYLIDYPYGCTEQTMSRFLPAAIVANTLTKLGVSREAVANHVFGGIERSTAGETHTSKKNLAALDRVTRAGLDRLYDFQHDDGGWGWWKEGSSDHYMTAYVVWGLSLARDAGMNVRSDALARAADYLDTKLVQETGDIEMQAWMLHALGAYRHGGPNDAERRALNNSFEGRGKLRAYGKALLAIALQSFADHDRALVVIRNLRDGVKIDRNPDQSILLAGGDASTAIATAHWGEDRFWWWWSDSPVESTAFALRALMAVDPQNELVEPTMNWLVKNRRGNQWSNTKDTAISVLALNDYLTRSGELKQPVAFAVDVNGTQVGKYSLTPAEMIAAPSVITVDSKLVRDGENRIGIHRTSAGGAVYFAASATFFSTEEPVTPAGNELFVTRDYYRLVARPTLLTGYVYDRVLLKDGDEVKSGDRIEVVARVETKNDYDYLLFEDLKPAGFEATELVSGESQYARELKKVGAEERVAESNRDRRAVANTRRNLPVDANYTSRSEPVYRELRDRNVAMFISHLPQGYWEIRYELRAEVPGEFHALPLLGHAMYVPEIRANSVEQRVKVVE